MCCQVATLVRADWLFLLTDVPSLFTANPSTDPSAEPIHEVHDIAALQACPYSPPVLSTLPSYTTSLLRSLHIIALISSLWLAESIVASFHHNTKDYHALLTQCLNVLQGCNGAGGH